MMTMNGPELSTDERLRYARHLALPEVGEEGQKRLKAARVLFVGARHTRVSHLAGGIARWLREGRPVVSSR